MKTLATIILLITSIIFQINAELMTRESLLKICQNYIKVDKSYYIFDEKIAIDGLPADMNYHWKPDRLFFTLISENMQMSIYALDNGIELHKIKTAGLGQSTAVDNLNDIVYLATDNGVYKYNDDDSKDLYIAGEDVMYAAVSTDGNTMYIATFPQNRVLKITKHGHQIEQFPAIPNGHGLTLDPMNNIYFVATKTSYILKAGQTVPNKIKGLPTDKVTGVTVSRTDDVYAMDENSNLYLIDAKDASARFLGNFNLTQVNSFTLDAYDNVFVGVKAAIVKFKRTTRTPCTPVISRKKIPKPRKGKTQIKRNVKDKKVYINYVKNPRHH